MTLGIRKTIVLVLVAAIFLLANMWLGMNWLQENFTLERGLLAGLALLLIGLSFGMRIFIIWAQHGFENLFELRTGLVALTLAVSGTQVIFAALFLSLLQVQTRND